jgi:iron complex outermembrane recepter protein
LPAQRASTSDTARLLEDIPGVSSYGAGGISSLPVVHGIADDRLRTQVDGMDLMTACPNHMNPALSFIDPSKVASVQVFAGIAPVSVGGDSIGGAIQVKSAPPKFAGMDEGLLAEGQGGVFSRSNGNARGNHYGFTLAGQFLNLSYTESNSESDNYSAAGEFKKPGAWKTLSGGRTVAEREVGASEYSGSQNREVGLALRLFGKHVVEFGVSEQKLDYEGFPNQRMDMVASMPDPSDPLSYSLDKGKPANVNQLANFHYTGQFGWGDVETRLFHQRLRHHMDMLPERFNGMMMPMDTVATTDGGLLKASIDISPTDVLRIGYDFQKYRLDDWWPPLNAGVSMCCNDFWNVRDGRRDRVGVFAEWEAQWNKEWLTLLGVRGDTVKSDAGRAQGYSNSYSGDSNRFNGIQHAREEHHVDLTLMVRYAPDATQTYEAGAAQKTRSPNLYERYPWSYNSMAALMNNFVGDGNGYIGNPDLKPETAHTLSLGGDWHDENHEKWTFKVTGYRTYVQAFIDAQRCTPAMNTQCTASNATTTNSYVKLQYVNQSALLYGIDLSGQAELGRIEGVGSFSFNGMASFVRGKNRSTRDNLYHIMPLDTKLALVHRLGSWTNSIDVEIVDDKKLVSGVRNEVRTPSYTLLNLRTSYELKHARIDVALENALDKSYLLPLGGAYVGQGNAMTIGGIPWGMVVPGRGRSLNVAMNIHF